MAAVNCWDFKKCGRQPGGDKVANLGICPAVTNKSTNGTNQGTNAGRICWAVTGTFCGGEVQGTSAQKMNSCMNCVFYKQVKQEEGANFKLMPVGSPSVTG